VEDALFATLDPTTRRSRTTDGRIYTLTDTVGFVRHLPHQLVESFRSTLEEIGEADLLLHVVDGSDDNPEEQVSAVREVLGEINASSVREIIVVNKVDTAEEMTLTRLRHLLPEAVFVSARTGAGLKKLRDALEEALPRRDREVQALVPYSRGDLVARAHDEGEVLHVGHGANGTELQARVPPALAAELERFAVAPDLGALPR